MKNVVCGGMMISRDACEDEIGIVSSIPSSSVDQRVATCEFLSATCELDRTDLWQSQNNQTSTNDQE